MYDQLLEKLKILPLLIVVASLAFAVRLGEVVVGNNIVPGVAIAEEVTQQAKETVSASEKSDDTQKDDIEKEHIDWQDSQEHDIEFSSVKAELFQALAQRRKDLEGREQTLERREALLKASEQQINRKFLELEKIKSEIEGLLQQQTAEEKRRIGSLVKIYEGMKAKDAAKIFNTLDMDILIDVTSAMSERKLSPVMAAMDPDRARSVTIFLAEQISLPPSFDE
jgi:flagellar motility protein MotE (MotC chaperone)